MDCSKNQALVSWSASEGALSYKVTAQSRQGAVSSCESTELMCILTNLTCGQSYAVQVVAQDDICSSLPSPATNFKSGRTYGWKFECQNVYLVDLVYDLLSLRSLSQFPACPKLAQWFWTASPTRPCWTGTTLRGPCTTPQQPSPLVAMFPLAAPTLPTAS